MNPKSQYCLMRITSRSGLGESLKTASTSATLRTTSIARIGLEMPRTGREALENEGRPDKIAIIARLRTATRPIQRCKEEVASSREEVASSQYPVASIKPSERSTGYWLLAAGYFFSHPNAFAASLAK